MRKNKQTFKDAIIRPAGVIYKHGFYGFKLYLPYSVAGRISKSLIRNGPAGSLCNTEMTIGNVTLGVHHLTKSLHGEVPAAWLVDLNADSAVVEETEELFA